MEEKIENQQDHKDTLIFTLSNEPSFEITNSQILDDRDFRSKTYIFELPRNKTVILEIERPSRESVSYTHLTLPTKA